MTFLVVLAVVAAVLALDTLRRMRTDGAGPTSPPRSHLDDPRFGPASR